MINLLLIPRKWWASFSSFRWWEIYWYVSFFFFPFHFESKTGSLIQPVLQNLGLVSVHWFHPSGLTFTSCRYAALGVNEHNTVCNSRWTYFLIRKSTEGKVLEIVTVSQYLLLIAVLRVLFYIAQVCWTAYQGILYNVCAAIQTTKNNCFCGVDLTSTVSQNDSCRGP